MNAIERRVYLLFAESLESPVYDHNLRIEFSTRPATVRLSCHSGSFTCSGAAIVFVLIGFTWFGGPAKLRAQEKSAQQQFNAATERLRGAIIETKRTGLRYFHSPAAEADDWRSKWQKAADEGNRAASEMKNAAEELLLSGEKPSPEIVAIGKQLQGEAMANLEYERTYQIAKRLIELDVDVYNSKLIMVRTALLTNRFSEAKTNLEEVAAEISGLPESEIALFRRLEDLETSFQHEIELRAAEEKAGDLPQVELETSKGKITIELFENQAPETVANFIYLVENNFFDEVIFHRVVKNVLPLAVAQAGLYSAHGPQNPGYTIYDEDNLPDARYHFRGVLSMAKVDGIPNSGGGQFFITQVPIPYLNGHHTAFARIVSDMRVLDKIQATATMDEEGKEVPVEGITYDRILTARVLRKRDHEYKPHRVEQK